MLSGAKSAVGQVRGIIGSLGTSVGSSLGRATKAVGSGLGSAVSGVGTALSTGLVAGVGAAAAAFAGSVLIFKEGIESIDDLASQGQIATNLGLTAEAFTGMAGAAKASGSDTRDFLEGLVTLSGRATEAAAGTGEISVQMFKKLGINAKEFKNLGVDEQFYAVFEALQKVQNPAERVGLLLQAFGEDTGKNLVKLLGRSSAELKTYAGSFAVANQEMLRIQSADKAWKGATASMGKVWRQVVIAIAPVIEMISVKLVSALEKLQPTVTVLTQIFATYWGVMVDVFGEVFDAVFELGVEFGKWAKEFLGLGVSSKTVEQQVTDSLRAIGVVGAYVFETLRAGVGVLAVALGFVIEALTDIGTKFNAMLATFKSIPVKFRPDWMNGFLLGVQDVEIGSRKVSDELKKWGMNATEGIGKLAQQVNNWFDKRANRPKPDPVAEALLKPNPKPIIQPVKLSYEAVGAALKGSREAYSIEARFRNENRLNPQLDLQRKQLAAQERGNQLLQQVANGVKAIQIPQFNVF